MKEINSFAPFPIYDTEEIKELEIKLQKEEVYDAEKVECCANCKNLHLVVDEFDNVWCNKCHSINEIEELENIKDYLKKYGDIWN